MARMEDLPDYEREFLLNMEMPSFAARPWVTGPSLEERRIAAVTTAGKVFLELKAVCLESDDPVVKALGTFTLVPRSQLHRLPISAI